jgi:hypothetical protein
MYVPADAGGAGNESGGPRDRGCRTIGQEQRGRGLNHRSLVPVQPHNRTRSSISRDHVTWGQLSGRWRLYGSREHGRGRVWAGFIIADEYVGRGFIIAEECDGLLELCRPRLSGHHRLGTYSGMLARSRKCRL